MVERVREWRTLIWPRNGKRWRIIRWWVRPIRRLDGHARPDAGQGKTREVCIAKRGRWALRCRERCFANGLVMRHVGDRMIIAPPLVITPDEIDTLVERARKSLDECYAGLKADGLLKSA